MGRESYLVAAAVALKSSREGNRVREKEAKVQSVEDDHDDRVDGPVGVERRREEVEEREQPERRRPHGVVDRCRVSGEGLRDHVTDEGHDKDREDELSC